MTNRIPPPLLTLFLAALMIYFARRFDGYVFAAGPRFWVGAALGIVGLAVMMSAARHFRRQKTTVNPFRPERTSSLVLGGIYERTRNPMYLGMGLILGGVTVGLGYLPNVLLIIGFVLYMSLFQIKPEERALSQNFGEEYINYMKRVRRWI